MGRAAALINRSVPFLIFFVCLATILRFVAEGVHSVSGWLSMLASFAHAWWGSILIVALLLWAVVGLGLLLRWGRLPAWIVKRKWAMDVLSRLTNRAALEERLKGETTPIFIDADALAEALKARVIGQDAICDDLSAQIRRRMALQQRGKTRRRLSACRLSGHRQDLSRQMPRRRTAATADPSGHDAVFTSFVGHHALWLSKGLRGIEQLRKAHGGTS